MQLSEFAASESDEAYGVVVDSPDFFPRQGIRRITFVARADQDGIDQDILDTIIAYKTAGIDVGLEVPFGLPVDASSLLDVAMPLNIDLRLLPPDDASEQDGYLASVSSYARGIPARPGYAKPVAPVSDGLMIMIARRLTGDDGPMEGSLIDGFPAQRSEDLLEAIRSGFVAALGGKEHFDEYIDLHVAAVHEDGRRKVADHVLSQSPAA